MDLHVGDETPGPSCATKYRASSPRGARSIVKLASGEQEAESCLEIIDSELGEAYQHMVEVCLRSDEMEEPVFHKESLSFGSELYMYRPDFVAAIHL
ncbi:hypothetical protein IMZ48_49765 [Candidatus Bathyarchaeota archaeon]|nr:hypothetical protein [Candidatus Bathyarchaeota archaeon]